MNLYLAPLEGITGHIYRNALHQCFDGFDKYLFHLSVRIRKDISAQERRRM